MICTSMPYWLWKPGAINCAPFWPAATYGIPLIRTNIKPPTMVRDVPMVNAAHVHRDVRTGSMKRATTATARIDDVVVAIIA